MLDVKCESHLAEVRAFADSLGPEARARLEQKLAYLEHYDGPQTLCVLSKDYAAHSFEVLVFRAPEESGERDLLLVGGLIFHQANEHVPWPHWSLHT